MKIRLFNMGKRLYQKELMDHYKFPRNKKNIMDANFFADDGNPSCGDKIHIEGKIENGKIVKIGFSGSGCVISQASASMLTEEVLDKNVDVVLGLTKDNIINLLHMDLGPNRLKCAILSLHVLKKALVEYKKNHDRL